MPAHPFVPSHQTSNTRRNQSTLHSYYVLGHQPDSSPHLSCNTDRQLSILIALVVIPPTRHKIVIHITALHARQYVQQKDGVGEGVIFEGSNLGAFAALACHIVGPSDHVLV